MGKSHVKIKCGPHGFNDTRVFVEDQEIYVSGIEFSLFAGETPTVKLHVPDVSIEIDTEADVEIEKPKKRLSGGDIAPTNWDSGGAEEA